MLPPKVVCEITQEEIGARVRTLADEINAWAQNEPLVAVSVLKGGFVFFSDLVRLLSSPVRCEFIGISSAESIDTRSGEMIFNLDTTRSVSGENVILVDELINTGLTLAYLQRVFKARQTKSVRTCVLAAKQKHSVIPIGIDYLGFTLDERYYVGYGMDYRGWFRELPYIGTVHL